MIDAIFFSVILLLCLYGVYYFYTKGIMQMIGFARIFKSKQWKITKGKVIDAEYKFMKYKEPITEYKYRTRVDFVLKKTYTYTVNGLRYKSNQGSAADSLFWRQFKSISKLPKKKDVIFYEENPKTKQLEKGKLNVTLYFNNKDTLQKKAKSIIGEEVQVYFNPNDPEKSCLSIKTDNITLLSSIVMLIFGTIATYMVYFIGKDYLMNSINTIAA